VWYLSTGATLAVGRVVLARRAWRILTVSPRGTVGLDVHSTLRSCRQTMWSGDLKERGSLTAVSNMSPRPGENAEDWR
jgi:hypothetical protein